MIFLPGPERIVPFFITIAIIELTPGPNMGYLAIVAGRWGRRAGLATVAGITLGLSMYLLAAIVGATEGLLRVTWLYEGLRWSGVIYLLWLALETWRGTGDPSPERADGEPSARRLFLRGLFANLLNPKAALFYGALLPGFTDPRRGPVALQLLVLGAMHLTLAVLVHLAIVFTAAGARPTVKTWRSNGADTAVRRVFAAGLVAVAVWMAWETRRAAGA